MGTEFKGKVAVVTGAAGGINRVILTRLAEEGAKCVLVDINEEWGQSSAATLRDRDLEVTYIRTDVRYGDQVNAAVERAVETYGRLDILVDGRRRWCPSRDRRYVGCGVGSPDRRPTPGRILAEPSRRQATYQAG